MVYTLLIIFYKIVLHIFQQFYLSLCVHVLESIYQPSFSFVEFKKAEGSAILSSGDWVLSAEELASKFTPRTKAIVINTPNNPLGKVRYLCVSFF